MIIELEITALASGGDGIAREPGGRVVFVPLTAPGDRVRVRIVEQKKSFARGELVEVVAAGAARVEPVCPEVARGCGGCQWQQVARVEQLRAKQQIVAGALRKLEGLAIHEIADPCPPLGWRRRARFHVERGAVGLYIRGSHRLLPLRSCPQLEPALDVALAKIAKRSPPDGELALLLGHGGQIVVGTEQRWPAAAALVGEGFVGAVTGPETIGVGAIEVEPGLVGGPHDFAQASAAGNAALIALVEAALGPPPVAGAQLVELYAGQGNFTRGLAAAGWAVHASDVTTPRATIPGVHAEVGAAPDVLARLDRADAVLLDPPRAGAIDAVAGIARLAPRCIVYVSCDPATLARDAAKLVEAGYRATDCWPIDLMPQTSHIEAVVRLIRV